MMSCKDLEHVNQPSLAVLSLPVSNVLGKHSFSNEDVIKLATSVTM